MGPPLSARRNYLAQVAASIFVAKLILAASFGQVDRKERPAHAERERCWQIRGWMLQCRRRLGNGKMLFAQQARIVKWPITIGQGAPIWFRCAHV
jgi:hypothetical protein